MLAELLLITGAMLIIAAVYLLAGADWAFLVGGMGVFAAGVRLGRVS